MPTTPNYGWDTPADTDYVTNGALAIRTMANDADATVYSVQTTLDAEKVDKAGDTMTGPLIVPNNASLGRAVALRQDASSDAILQFLNSGGTTQQAYIAVNGAAVMILGITQNGNYLTINNVGETLRTTDGETRPIPFAMEAGRRTVSANSSSTITLNTGRFTRTPLILITPERNTALAGVDFHVGDRSTSSFKIFNNDNESWVFNWQAIQMTATDAEG
jgi:hypothetical protein